jgi:hypothetical protein
VAYTDAELLDALRAFADELGHPPTVPETNDREGFPGADTFVRRFGTWNAALDEAGLETRDRGRSEADRRDGLNGASLADYWLCSHCNRPFARADALERHVASEHEDESEDEP